MTELELMREAMGVNDDLKKEQVIGRQRLYRQAALLERLMSSDGWKELVAEAHIKNAQLLKMMRSEKDPQELARNMAIYSSRLDLLEWPAHIAKLAADAREEEKNEERLAQLASGRNRHVPGAFDAVDLGGEPEVDS